MARLRWRGWCGQAPPQARHPVQQLPGNTALGGGQRMQQRRTKKQLRQ
jgi:hypothetical protein